MIVDNTESIKAMRRAVYYASKGIRTAYARYEGNNKGEVKDLLWIIDDVYAALKVEEESRDAR